MHPANEDRRELCRKALDLCGQLCRLDTQLRAEAIPTEISPVILDIMDSIEAAMDKIEADDIDDNPSRQTVAIDYRFLRGI